MIGSILKIDRENVTLHALVLDKVTVATPVEIPNQGSGMIGQRQFAALAVDGYLVAVESFKDAAPDTDGVVAVEGKSFDLNDRQMVSPLEKFTIIFHPQYHLPQFGTLCEGNSYYSGEAYDNLQPE